MNHSLNARARKAGAQSVGLTALAGVAAALVAAPAGAAVVSETNLALDVPDGGSVLGLGGMTNVNLGNAYSYDGNSKIHTSQAYLYADGVTNTPLTAGVSVINSSSTFIQSAPIGDRTYDAKQNMTTSFGTGSGIYGVHFDNGAGVRYGWVDVSLQDNGAATAYGFTVNGYGYENSGASILAGQTAAPVPEPDTLAMMALGGLGLAVVRRRQRKTAQRSLAH